MTEFATIMSVESLESYGFREYQLPGDAKHDRNWQYCLRDRLGKRLYVQVRLWKFSKYSTSDRNVEDSFDAYAQFDMNGPRTFNVDLSVRDMTPQQVVQWFDNLFTKMGCHHYESIDDYESESDCYNCQKCGAYLGELLSKNPTSLCPACQYETDTGFSKVKKARK